jgi:two-component system, NarL family, invasion response regulator UvrY
MEPTKIKIALADDHVLLRNALASLIDGFGICQVIHQCGTGRELTSHIAAGHIPDVVILDLNMPDMDGFESADWLQQKFPDIKVLMLTMYDSELSLIRLLQAGVKGFLKKDIHPEELKFAIQSVVSRGITIPIIPRAGWSIFSAMGPMAVMLCKKPPSAPRSWSF